MIVFKNVDELHGSPDVGTLAGCVDCDEETMIDFLTGAGFRKNDDGQWELIGANDPAGWLQPGRSLLVNLDSESESGIDVYAVEVSTIRDDRIVREDYAVTLLEEYAYENADIDFNND